MCGLVGVLREGGTECAHETLRCQEYRGYDSYGFCGFVDDCIKTAKYVGAIPPGPTDAVSQILKESKVCLGHVRWATHGKITVENAHPHVSHDGKLAVVHNGVVSNHEHLRRRLSAVGIDCISETDTEVIANLCALEFSRVGSLVQAVQRVAHLIVGDNAFVVMHVSMPRSMIGAALGRPLFWIATDDALVITSDENAIWRFPGQGFRSGHYSVVEAEIGRNVREWQRANTSTWNVVAPCEISRKLHVAIPDGGLGTMMIRELLESPNAAHSARQAAENVELDIFRLSSNLLVLTGAGGSFFQALLFQYFLADVAKLHSIACPADEVESACSMGAGVHLVSFTQSGETQDVIRLLRLMKSMGCTSTVITNVESSSAAYLTNELIYQHSGLEVAVPSTKTTVGQAVVSLTIALRLARFRETISDNDCARIVHSLNALPHNLESALRECRNDIRRLANALVGFRHLLILGEGKNYPVCMEIALKLKEVCYLHSEAASFGMVKHGILAMIDDSVAVLVVGRLYDNRGERSFVIEELAGRGGRIFGAVHSSRINPRFRHFEMCVNLPELEPETEPVLTIAAGQLLAYELGIALGRPIDRPRHLAKSVTVS